MATKPTTLPTWATNASTTTDPGASAKATGWTVGQVPPAKWFNWLFNWIFQWLAFVNAPAGSGYTPAFTVTAGTGVAGSTGLIGLIADANGIGLVGAAGPGGSGTPDTARAAFKGSGILGVADSGDTAVSAYAASGGYGLMVKGQGAPMSDLAAMLGANPDAASFVAGGSGAGAYFYCNGSRPSLIVNNSAGPTLSSGGLSAGAAAAVSNGGTGAGIQGTGGAGAGVVGISTSGTGTTGTSTSGSGVSGTGGGTAAGVVGVGGNSSGATGTGAGGYFTGGAHGVGVYGAGTDINQGVYGIGGSASGTGVAGVGGGSNGNGVTGGATGTGTGVTGTSPTGYGAQFFGNSTKAPMNLVPQSAPSSKAEGDIWVTGHAIHVADASGNDQRAATIVKTAAPVAPAAQAITTTATATNVTAGTLTVPAGGVPSAVLCRMRFYLAVHAASGTTITVGLEIGGTKQNLDISASTSGDFAYCLEAVGYFNGTFTGMMSAGPDPVSGALACRAVTAFGTCVVASGFTLIPFVSFGTGNAGNTATAYSSSLEIIGV